MDPPGKALFVVAERISEMYHTFLCTQALTISVKYVKLQLFCVIKHFYIIAYAVQGKFQPAHNPCMIGQTSNQNISNSNYYTILIVYFLF